MKVYQFNINSGTLWVKLKHEGLAQLDRHYREGTSVNRASPFTINMHHRCADGYYEFSLRQFMDIWSKYDDMTVYFDSEIFMQDEHSNKHPCSLHLED